jgi:hypothetical protein
MRYASLNRLIAETRDARAPLSSPFKANAGGPFLKPRSFDPGNPSTRALDAARDRIERDKRDADALRNSYNNYMRRTYGI